jgi:hypothetical protein
MSTVDHDRSFWVSKYSMLETENTRLAMRIARYEAALWRIGKMESPPYISAPGIALEALGSSNDGEGK